MARSTRWKKWASRLRSRANASAKLKPRRCASCAIRRARGSCGHLWMECTTRQLPVASSQLSESGARSAPRFIVLLGKLRVLHCGTKLLRAVPGLVYPLVRVVRAFRPASQTPRKIVSAKNLVHETTTSTKCTRRYTGGTVEQCAERPPHRGPP